MEQIFVKAVRADAPLPKRATPGSAGYDLQAYIEAAVSIPPGERAVIPTGIAIQLPADTVGLVFGRSGLGVRAGVLPANGVGVIDSDYRGEIMVGLLNTGDTAFVVQPGDRIAQLVITPVLTPPLVWAEELDETGRSSGGFGSTGR